METRDDSLGTLIARLLMIAGLLVGVVVIMRHRDKAAKPPAPTNATVVVPQ